MAYTSGGCHDLRKYQDSEAVYATFSKIISGGKLGYRAVIEKKEEEKKCSNCNIRLEGTEKFCPECGAKLDWQKKQSQENTPQQTDAEQSSTTQQTN